MSSSILPSINLKGHWEAVEQGASDTGKTADRSQWRIARDVLVAETPELARERAEEVLVRNYYRHQVPNRTSNLMAASKIDPEMPDSAVDVEYMMEHLWIVGDPQECADRIRKLYEDVGGFGTFLAVTQDPDNHQWEQQCLELLMNEVGPRVSDLN